MMRVIVRAQQAFLFPEQRHEKDAASWVRVHGGKESPGYFDHGHRSAAVIVGAVVDTFGVSAQVIVMRGHQQVLIAQYGVGTPQNRGHIPHYGFSGAGGLARCTDTVKSRPAPSRRGSPGPADVESPAHGSPSAASECCWLKFPAVAECELFAADQQDQRGLPRLPVH